MDRSAFVVRIAIALLSVLPSSARGQPPSISGVPASEPLFGRGGIGLEFSGGVLVEAWNLNESREWLVDGTAGVWWAFADRALLVTELHFLRVYQEPFRTAFVNGFTPLLRWRVHRARRWTLFVDAGPGLSWSDTVVPPRGTKFNYLLLAGAGVSWPVARQAQVVGGFRWLHISNSGREGRSRNPDIEAIGGYAGVSVALSR